MGAVKDLWFGVVYFCPNSGVITLVKPNEPCNCAQSNESGKGTVVCGTGEGGR